MTSKPEIIHNEKPGGETGLDSLRNQAFTLKTSAWANACNREFAAANLESILNENVLGLWSSSRKRFGVLEPGDYGRRQRRNRCDQGDGCFKSRKESHYGYEEDKHHNKRHQHPPGCAPARAAAMKNHI